MVKLTSIASVVALPELLYSADMARSVTFNSSPIVLAAAIYLVMLWPVVRLISRLERRMATMKCGGPLPRIAHGRRRPDGPIQKADSAAGGRAAHARPARSGQGRKGATSSSIPSLRSPRFSRAGT